MSDQLFEQIFVSPTIAALTQDEAWLQAMLDVEAALAGALADVGLGDQSDAAEVARCARAELFDVATIASRAGSSANPVIAMVTDLRALVAGEGAARLVHRGATSQDIVDTAMMSIAGRILAIVDQDLARLSESLAGLADHHRATVMVGRTLLQHAVPITFGLKAANWLVAVDDARQSISTWRSQRLAVQFGGAAGTLAVLGDRGTDVADALAQRLGLAARSLPWHSSRARQAELATTLAITTGVVAKIAHDVGLMMQTEIGEAFEPDAPGQLRGTSSTMPHKRNPVVATTVTAAATRAAAAAAIVMAGVGAHEHERAMGHWHAEWQPMNEIFRLSATAVGAVADLVGGLELDPVRMLTNLESTRGLVMAESLATRLAVELGPSEATRLVEALCAKVIADSSTLAQVAAGSERVRAFLSGAALAETLDPSRWLGSNDVFIDRALAAHREVLP